jgi:hypothetical protein
VWRPHRDIKAQRRRHNKAGGSFKRYPWQAWRWRG